MVNRKRFLLGIKGFGGATWNHSSRCVIFFASTTKRSSRRCLYLTPPPSTETHTPTAPATIAPRTHPSCARYKTPESERSPTTKHIQNTAPRGISLSRRTGATAEASWEPRRTDRAVRSDTFGIGTRPLYSGSTRWYAGTQTRQSAVSDPEPVSSIAEACPPGLTGPAHWHNGGCEISYLRNPSYWRPASGYHGTE